MEHEPEYVWYASYGSNMCIERFLCYIRGGAVEGMQTTCIGCTDKTLPLKSKRIMLPHELYFSETSTFWGGGGVAFLNPTPSSCHSSHCRLYLLSRDQFMEVVNQENRYSHVTPFTLKDLHKKKKIKISSGWYSLVMYLGDLEGHPIFTFTSEHCLDPDGSSSGYHHFVHREFNPPSLSYLTVISVGLQQMGLSYSDVLQYYSNVKGIKDLASTSFLRDVLQNALEFQQKYDPQYLYRLLSDDSTSLSSDKQFTKQSISSTSVDVNTTFDNWNHLLTVSLEYHQYEHVYHHSFNSYHLKPRLCRSQHDMTS